MTPENENALRILYGESAPITEDTLAAEVIRLRTLIRTGNDRIRVNPNYGGEPEVIVPDSISGKVEAVLGEK